MIVRFNTHEEAGLFVAEQASEGVDCVILDTHAASLWGAAAVGGVRVAILGQPNAGSAQSGFRDNIVSRSLRFLFLVITGIGFLVLALSLFLAFYTDPQAMFLLLIFGAALVWILLNTAVLVSIGAKSILIRREGPTGLHGYTVIAWIIIALSFCCAFLGVLPFG